jgi:LCP family protein required for cell wall assembly
MRVRKPKPIKTKTQNVLHKISYAVAAVFVLSSLYLMYELLNIQIFDPKQLAIGGVVLAVLAILTVAAVLGFQRTSAAKIISMVLALALTAVFITGGYYVQQTSDVFTMLSDSDTENDDEEDDGVSSDILSQADLLSSKMAVTITTYAMNDTGITKISQLSGKTIGVATELDEETANALAQLKEGGASSFETVEYPTIYALTDALYNGEVDAIVFPEKYHDDILVVADDYNQYNALTTFTNVVDTYIYYEPIPDEMKNPADAVSDITEDFFTVLISGSDSYGSLAATSRSDVNMVVAINPKTAQVVIVSLPRDTYLEVTCDKNKTACESIEGMEDKLTHTGLYGIGTTESSIEDFLGITINYTVRVNFSSLINVVDAVGGIDVYVEEGLEVETFYANGTQGVTAGTNHLEGERALAFARERYAYTDGDIQRIKNQQIVLKALIQKMMSPSMIINYPAFIRALSTAFSTNMSSKQIRELISYEISNFPDWNIQSIALFGSDGTEFAASLGDYASVTFIDEEQIEYIEKLFKELKAGEIVTVRDFSAEKEEAEEEAEKEAEKTGSQNAQSPNGAQHTPVQP